MKTFLLLTLMISVSCNQNSTEKSQIIFDTITPLNHQIKVLKNKNNKIDIELSIKYENNILKISDVNFDIAKEQLSNRIIDLKNFIGFRNQCGYNCWKVDFYNLNRKSKAQTIYNVLQIQPQKNLIAYFNSEENQIDRANLINNQFELALINLTTGKRQFIKLENIYITQNLMENLFSVKFENGLLFIQWLSQEKGPENLITKRKKVSINI